jgi:hypothetical protein
MGIAGRQMKPFIVDENPFAPLSQLLYADAAVYVKNFMEFEALAADKLLRLATILHDVYHSYDLCALALDHYDKKKGTSLNQAYIHRITTLNPSDEEH